MHFEVWTKLGKCKSFFTILFTCVKVKRWFPFGHHQGMLDFFSVSKQVKLPSLSLWILSFKHTSNYKRSIVKKIWDRSLLMTDAQEFPPCSWKCFFTDISKLSMMLYMMSSWCNQMLIETRSSIKVGNFCFVHSFSYKMRY